MDLDSYLQLALQNKALIGLGSFALLQIYYWYKRTFFTGPRNALPKLPTYVQSSKKDVVYLYQFAPINNGKNSSPFCLKLESYLQWRGIPYEIVKGDHYDKNPKQKLPFIELNGEGVSDSTLIIKHLQSKFGNPDSNLSANDIAISTAFQRLVEDHLYFAIVYFRWIYPSSWAQWAPNAFQRVPALIRPFISSMIRNTVMNSLWGQGTGRHSDEEIVKFAQDDIEAISTFLGTKKFFFGDEPHTIDFVIYGAFSSILHIPMEGSPLLEVTKKYSNLVKYTDRIYALLDSKVLKKD